LDLEVKHLGGRTKLFTLKFKSKGNILMIGLGVKMSKFKNIIRELRKRPRK